MLNGLVIPTLTENSFDTYNFLLMFFDQQAKWLWSTCRSVKLGSYLKSGPKIEILNCWNVPWVREN